MRSQTVWKKTEDQSETPAMPTSTPSLPQSNRPGAIATLGPSIVIKGDLTGEEDLMIEGRVEGEIRLTKNSVTVGRNGRVKADIYGKRVQVEGEVRGNLHGETEVIIRASGRVQGNLISPRVTLENGSKFKGSIDMEAAQKSQPEPEKKPTAEKKSLQGSVQTSIGAAARPGASSGSDD
jgi:cytoskeletal protein CcmA (bactofilin family)